MQYCSKCKVSIETPHKRCPLCQGKLEGEGEEESKLFPARYWMVPRHATSRYTIPTTEPPYSTINPFCSVT